MDGLTAVAHDLFLLALAIWVGGVAVLLVVLRGGRTRPEDVAFLEDARQRAGTMMRWSVIALIVTLAADVALHALATARGDAGAAFSGPTLRAFLFASRYGQASVARWLLLVAALWAADEIVRAPGRVAVRLPRPSRHALGIVAPGLRPPLRQADPDTRPRRAVPRGAWLRVSALCACGVLAATAVADLSGPISLAAVEAVHLGATALWLGGSVALAASIVPSIRLAEPSRRPFALLTVVDRFTPLAVLGALVLVLTGLWEGRHGALPTSQALSLASRWALVLKAILLVALAAISAWSALGLRPRLRRLAMRARRDRSTAPAAEHALASLRRVVRYSPALAVPALLCGGLTAPAPTRLRLPAPLPPAVEVRAGAMTLALRLLPARGSEDALDMLLTDRQGKPIRGADLLVAGRSLALRGVALPQRAVTDSGGGHYRLSHPFPAGGPWQMSVTLRAHGGGTVADFALQPSPLRGPVTSLAPLGRMPAGGARAATGTGTGAAAVARGIDNRCVLPGRWDAVGPRIAAHTAATDPLHPTWLYSGGIDGVRRSTDGGMHWTSVSNGLSGTARVVWALGILPDRSLIAATDAGLYRSADGARHWRPAGLAGHAIYTLAGHVAGHLILMAGGVGGIYRSDDTGAHWRLIYDAGSAAVTSLAWPTVRLSLIAAGISPGPQPLTVSTDGGITWRRQANGLPAKDGIATIAIAPDAQVVYAGTTGQGAYRAADPSGRWEASGAGLGTGADVQSFMFDPANAHGLYAATASGVYHSADGGEHWASCGAGLSGPGLAVTSLTLTGGPHPTLYAATANGLYRRPAR